MATWAALLVAAPPRGILLLLVGLAGSLNELIYEIHQLLPRHTRVAWLKMQGAPP